MFRAFPRHSVDITKKEYEVIASFFWGRNLTEGEYIHRFETLFAKYIDTRFAISLPSARLGLYLLLKFFNFSQEDEVIITPFTHQSIFTVIKAFLLKPVFVDISPDTHNISPEAARSKITKKTKLIIVTHMLGQPCNMDGFMDIKKEYGLKIIEDCAMACGATYKRKKVGGFSDASIFSFGKAKAISTFGGGMLCTNDSNIHKHVQIASENLGNRKSTLLSMQIINSIIANILTRPQIFFFTLYPILRFLNIRDPYNPMEHKKDASIILDKIPDEWKVKLSNIQAAVGIEQLKNLDKNNQKRIENAMILSDILRNVKGITIPHPLPESTHIYLYYALYIQKGNDMNLFRKKLINQGIDSQLNELTTPQQLDVFGLNSNDYPVFKRTAQKLLTIPNGIYLTKEDSCYIAKQCKKIIESYC